MPRFEIEQYEMHSQKYRVEAASEAEAIKKLLSGLAEPVDNGLEFIGVCSDKGLPKSAYQELAKELGSLGIGVSGTLIQSIRSIEEVM